MEQRMEDERIERVKINPLQHFSYLFRQLFIDFIQLQKLMCGLKILQTLAINLLTYIDPSKCQ